MGCKNSKSVSTVPTTVKVKPASGKGRIQPMDLDSKPSELKATDTFITQDKTLPKNNSSDSLGSLGDGGIGGDSRQGSAGSKFSKHSDDSGLGEHGGDDDEVTYITELSDPALVQQVESGFQEKELDDLWVTGKAVPRRLSAKDKERQEEQRILATLQEEGLITRPQTRAGNGVCFEIVEESSNRLPLRPPPRLAKLEKRKKKKKKLTEWDIQVKLEKAEQKRKQHEKEKLDRISQLDKSQVQSALDGFVEHQKKIGEEKLQKVDVAAEKKEQKLRELQEKLRAKEAHAEEVRRRKKLRVMTVIESQGEYDMENPNLANMKMAEDIAMAGTGTEQRTTEMTQQDQE